MLDRIESRWRVRVVPPPELPLRGFTVGLVGEDGLPLGPAVVAAPDAGPEWVLEVRGPCSLSPGTIARVVLHTEGGGASVVDVVVARRRGVQAWLAADGILPVMSKAEFQPLAAGERKRLGRRWCWTAPAAAEECGAELSDELKDALAHLGVDLDEAP